MLPFFGGRSRAIKENRVDLPAPFGPISAWCRLGNVEADVVEHGASADVEADVADGNHGGCLSGVGLKLFHGLQMGCEILNSLCMFRFR